MTKEEIIDMAKKTGVIEGFNSVPPNIKAFAKLIAEKERDECAKLVDAEAKETGLCAYYANLIRSREQE